MPRNASVAPAAASSSRSRLTRTKVSLASDTVDDGGEDVTSEPDLCLSAPAPPPVRGKRNNAAPSPPPPPPPPRRVPEATATAATDAVKKPRLAPIFAPRSSNPEKSHGGDGGGSSSRWRWDEPLAPSRLSKPSCLLGRLGDPFGPALARAASLPEAQRRASVTFACFDLDGTLIVPKNGKKFPSPKDEHDYQFAFKNVQRKLREEQENGCVIAILSNQKQTEPLDLAPPRGGRLPAKLETWRRKVALLAPRLGCDSCAVLGACADDAYRKPALGMWEALVAEWERAGGRREWIALRNDAAGAAEEAVPKDGDGRTGSPSRPRRRPSFYVGDAAGRSGDHSDTDRKLALNADLDFFTPEPYFEGRAEAPYKLKGWRPDWPVASQLIYHPAERPLVRGPGSAGVKASAQAPSGGAAAAPATADEVEVVLFVGPPASGKTTLYRNRFAPAGYGWANQDTLKTRERCLAKVRESLRRRTSVAVDNTNRDRATRAHYVALAREVGCTIRAVWFDVCVDTLQHHNHFRAKGGAPDEPPRALIPPMAFSSYYKALEPPTTDEGLDEVLRVEQVGFVGDEEKRRRYSLWWT